MLTGAICLLALATGLATPVGAQAVIAFRKISFHCRKAGFSAKRQSRLYLRAAKRVSQKSCFADSAVAGKYNKNTCLLTGAICLLALATGLATPVGAQAVIAFRKISFHCRKAGFSAKRQSRLYLRAAKRVSQKSCFADSAVAGKYNKNTCLLTGAIYLLALVEGLEPPTLRLTAACSTD